MIITLDQALEMAESNNPALVAARAELMVAEAGLMGAQAAWDPMLGLNAGRSVQGNEGRQQGIYYQAEQDFLSWEAQISQMLPTGTAWNVQWSNFRAGSTTNYTIEGVTFEDKVDAAFQSQFTVGVSQQLLDGYRLRYNLEGVRQARLATSLAEAQLMAERQSVLQQAANAWFELAYADAALAVASEAVRVAEEDLRVVGALVEGGTLAPVEKTRAEAALAQARLTLIQAQHAQAAASDALAMVVGAPAGVDPATPAPPTLDLDAEAVVQAVLEGNPTLQAMRLAEEDAEARLAAARHAQLPGLALTLSYGQSGYDDQNGYSAATKEMLSGDLTTRSVGLAYEMPLLGRASRAQVGNAAATVSRSMADRQAMEQQLRVQALAAVRTLESAQAQVELARLNLDLAEQTLAAELALREEGRALERDVLESRAARDRAQLAVVRAEVDWQKAVVALKALEGQL